DAHHLLGGDLLFFPDVLEEAADAAVVHAGGEVLAPGFGARVVAPGPALGQAVLGELVQRVRPVVPVDEVEIGIARVVGDGAPVPGVAHGVQDGAVAAR